MGVSQGIRFALSCTESATSLASFFSAALV